MLFGNGGTNIESCCRPGGGHGFNASRIPSLAWPSAPFTSGNSRIALRSTKSWIIPLYVENASEVPYEPHVRASGGHRGGTLWLRKSVTIHAAPVIARFSALPAQLISLWGSANGAGSHTSNPKPISIAVSNRDVRRAERPDSSAMAASANAIVVVIAQNICPGGIHFGTKCAVAER